MKEKKTYLPLAALMLATSLAPRTFGSDTVIRVAPGAELTAQLQNQTAKIAVQKTPQIVEFVFGRKERGQFRPYGKTEPIAYELPFVVRVRFDAEPSFDRTNVTLTWEEGGKQQVSVVKTRENRTVFESSELKFQDPGSCRGLLICTESEEAVYER